MSEITVDVGAKVGDFAEDKDAARQIRVDVIVPALERGDAVILDFSSVSTATQSFLHALFSGIIRSRGPDALDHILFRGASETVRSLITIVAEYSQEGL